MTVVALCSAKGAPGVTTLACLLGAVWPSPLSVVVAECDPSGGDLAARFGFDSQVGMASFVLASRQAAATVSSRPHVQKMPGGLEVLVGGPTAEAARAVDAELAGIAALFKLGSDVVVDCGRVLADTPGQRLVLTHADVVVVVGADDVAAVVHIAALVDRLSRTISGALGLAVVGGTRGHAVEVAGATGTELAASIPIDQGTAAIVRGEPGRRRRLLHAPLVESAETVRRWVVQKCAHQQTESKPNQMGASKGTVSTTMAPDCFVVDGGPTVPPAGSLWGMAMPVVPGSGLVSVSDPFGQDRSAGKERS